MHIKHFLCFIISCMLCFLQIVLFGVCIEMLFAYSYACFQIKMIYYQVFLFGLLIQVHNHYFLYISLQSLILHVCVSVYIMGNCFEIMRSFKMPHLQALRVFCAVIRQINQLQAIIILVQLLQKTWFKNLWSSLHPFMRIAPCTLYVSQVQIISQIIILKLIFINIS